MALNGDGCSPLSIIFVTSRVGLTYFRVRRGGDVPGPFFFATAY